MAYMVADVWQKYSFMDSQIESVISVYWNAALKRQKINLKRYVHDRENSLRRIS